MSNIKPVTEESKAVFANLRLDDFGNLGLAASAINGISCDVIIAGDQDDEGVEIFPVAILVNEELFKLLENPADEFGDSEEGFNKAIDAGIVH